MPNTAKDSVLISAATALDAELGRFQDAVDAFKKLPLSSKKHLERATAALNALAESEQRLGANVQALVQAVAATREGQTTHLEVIRAKAETLKARSIEFQQLIGQFESLGQGAAALNARLTSGAAPVTAVLDEVTALATKAESLTALAREKDFDDVAHMADGLKQQLSALAGKLKPPTGPKPLLS
jgi:hypothetical protein